MLEREPNISDEDLLDVLSSNLCRCTGYQNIIKAVRSVAVAAIGIVLLPLSLLPHRGPGSLQRRLVLRRIARRRDTTRRCELSRE